ncbi:hypothetical protein EHE19_015340 [Ruminiclostridium herbifermentans]|uniref:ABM domain-containing protein n=1 Tax=Ruminiclostridium herbifermentans TaxID=2488810 RepID=A0A4U7JHR2_9FIRM|nr:hypothetical protein [Ruminiclostridium herbifermentans]QNU66240.1 hypothetical protein EHE19_015340 [Ruminiclostridium herbifermentans]
MPNVVEFTPFKLQNGVSVSDFLLASDKLQTEFIAKQKGYISRKLIFDGEKWADLVIWETMDDAKNAAAAWEKNAAADEYMTFIDEKSCTLTHFTVEKSY